MNGSLRIWGIVSGAAIVAILAGGVFVGVQPQLAAAETTDAATSTANTQNQATRLRLIALSKVAAKSDSLQVENQKLLKAVPEILKPNTLIRRLNEVAALDGVIVKAVAPGEASAYAAPTDANPVLAKTDPLITGSNFAVVPVTVVVAGTADAILQYAHDIQNDERLLVITSTQLTTSDGSITANFGGFIYTLQR